MSTPCPPIKKSDYKNGEIFSRKLGDVMIDNEPCQIFEQYQYIGCEVVFGEAIGSFDKCDGKYVYCYDKLLTRVTKCLSGTVVNTITYSGDKSHIEQVK